MPISPFARPRWTPEDARRALAALERSGQSVKAFATEHGLDPQRLYQWRRRLGEAERTTFREVIVRPSARLDPARYLRDAALVADRGQVLLPGE